MSKSARCIVLLATLLPIAPCAALHAQASGKVVSACTLLTADDIRKITGRNDLATVPADKEEISGHSNCIYSGAFDVGVTVASTTARMYEQMRDNYKNAPARLGYTVEPIAGLGDNAYYLIDKYRVKVIALRGAQEVTIALTKISMLPGKMPPESEAKAFALSLAKGAVAKLN